MLAFIAGRAHDHAFIQAITNDSSYYFNYPLSAYTKGKTVRIAGSSFGSDGVKLDIQQKGVCIAGDIQYQSVTPLVYDIMGPFKFFPMQCSHCIVSLHHVLAGQIQLNGQSIDFSGGAGYIEGDKGRSFPKTYSWLHCNDFAGKRSVSVSIADVPFAGVRFRGCICVVFLEGKEYRLATYLGVRVVASTKRQILLVQGKYRLEIHIDCPNAHSLLAPVDGRMKRMIYESPSCRAHFRFWIAGKVVFDEISDGVSFEYAV